MPYFLLLLLALTTLQARWPESPLGLGAAGSTLATAGCVAMSWLLASLWTRRYCRMLGSAGAERRQVLRRFGRRRSIQFQLQFGLFLLALYVFGWGFTIKDTLAELLPGWPGLDLVLLTPMFAGLVLSWLRFYDLEKSAHQLAVEGNEGPPFLSRWAYLGLQARYNLLLVVPPLFLMLLQESLYWLVPGLAEREHVLSFCSMLFLGVAFVSIPLLLRVLLGLGPLPAGPLRERLLAVCRRSRFRCSDILVWNTRQSMANAMVTGVLPWARYIVLTDRLARELSTEELEAVVGHEIGHIKHHHMFFFMIFLLGSLFVLGMLWQECEQLIRQESVRGFVAAHLPLLTGWFDRYEYIAAFPVLLVLGLYLFVVFGYISRRCEMQADIYGSQTVSNEVFINALEKVAVLNGIKRDKPGWFSAWRHPSIAKRVDFLMRMQEDPALEPRFQRRLGLVKWSMSLGLAVALGLTLWLGETVKPLPANPASVGAGARP